MEHEVGCNPAKVEKKQMDLNNTLLSDVPLGLTPIDPLVHAMLHISNIPVHKILSVTVVTPYFTYYYKGNCCAKEMLTSLKILLASLPFK